MKFLKNNGFSTFSQIRRKFFISDSTASMRLNALINANILSKKRFCDLIKEPRNSKYIPGIIEISINPNSLVYRLSTVFQETFSQSSKVSDTRMLMHQLMLNDVSTQLEFQFPKAKVFVDLETSQSRVSIGNKQPLIPDLVVEIDTKRIAIELERTTKSRNEYISRMTRYNHSDFTHVLFYYSRDRQLDLLMNIVGPYRKIGFVNYFDRNYVSSKYFGKKPFHEFLQLSFQQGTSLKLG